MSSIIIIILILKAIRKLWRICGWKRISTSAGSRPAKILIFILSYGKFAKPTYSHKFVISRWRLTGDLRKYNQPATADVLKIVKNDFFYHNGYDTSVLRLLGEVVRTFYPTIFFFSVLMEWTKERKYNRMHFQTHVFKTKDCHVKQS